MKPLLPHPIRLLIGLLLLSGAAGSLSAQILWTQTNGPEGGAVSSVTIDSSGRLFAGTEAGGVFGSPDQGSTWFARNAGLRSFHIRELESSPHGYIFGVTYDAGIYRYFNDDLPHWTPLD